ncbi:hypothetical protein SteCoe_6525 [Stentor coeruleus]|uniref:TNFR-Cys domain-containing protein n=1 Tax=Stentor coeruleus TaxID=5963 RepID=A0A1R2CPZ1_9CILI|nr:hypothetical protein SteCoe_6525 [Stentor coeruleus]
MIWLFISIKIAYSQLPHCTVYSGLSCSACDTGYCLIDDVCVILPTGYSISGDYCSLNTDLVFNLALGKYDGTIQESALNLQGITGNNQKFYPYYDTNDPYIGTYDRGYYFNGVSSYISFPNTNFILAPNFKFGVFFYPISFGGVLLTKQNPTTVQEYFTFYVTLDIGDFAWSFNTPYGFMDWPTNGYVTGIGGWIYIEFASSYSSSRMYNYEESYFGDVITNSGGPDEYIDDTSDLSTLFIGAKKMPDGSFSGFFKGFIYSMDLYNSYHATGFLGTCDPGCYYCKPDQSCITDCTIDKYWTGPGISDCANCPAQCTKGCRSGTSTCSICDDIHCNDCDNIAVCLGCIDGADFVAGVCTCLSNYVESGLECIYCNGYVLANVCFPCGYYCSTCTSSACTTCSVAHSSPSTGVDCACDSGYTDSGTTCDLCNGYVSSNICYPCGHFCSACTSSACTTCSVTHSSPSTGVDCACDSGYTDSGTTCDLCNGYVSSNICYPCGHFCSACTSSACTTCSVTHSSPSTGVDCACNSGYTDSGTTCDLCNGYVTSNTCNPCGHFCSACTSSACTTCSVAHSSPSAGVDCACDSGYTDSGTTCDLCNGYITSNTCNPCGYYCSSCTSSACTTCSVAHSSPSTGVNCACDSGYTDSGTTCDLCNGYVTSNTCNPCGHFCSTCTSLACTACSVTHSSPSTGVDCACDSGYADSGTTCDPCGHLCSVCTTSACTTCSVAHSSPSTGVDCACDSGYIDSGTTCDLCNGYVSSNICYPCGHYCSACTSSACTTCSVLNSSPSTGVDCACSSGYTDSGTTCDLCNGYIISNVCYPCGHFCSTCTSSTCTACNVAHSSPSTGVNCACDSGYADSGTTCDPCGHFCSVCTTSACTTCSVSHSSPSTGVDCACNSGYADSGTSCDPCGHFCSVCTTSACTTCSVTNSSPSSGVDCACNSGYTDSGSSCVFCNGYITTNACYPCGHFCSACTSSACTTCSVSHSSSSTGVDCACDSGYADSGTTCDPCGHFCSICTTSACTTCSVSNSSPSTGIDCACNAGYADSGISCDPCGHFCSVCTTSSCTTCSVTHSSPSSGVDCACDSGYIDSGSSCVFCNGYISSNVCFPCGHFCSACTSSACTTCSVSHSSPSTGIECACDSGYTDSGTACDLCNGYITSNTCNPCGHFCSACTSSACTTCSVTHSSPSTGVDCACDSGYTDSGSTCDLCNGYIVTNVCYPCGHFCSTCTSSACTACSVTYSSPSTGVDCACNSGYADSGTSCIPCGHFCSACTTTACTTCNVLNSSPSTGVDCACNSGYTDSGTTCDLCNGYVSSNICHPCGYYCSACTSSACTTCSVLNSSPSTSVDCACNSGYTDSGSTCDLCNGYVSSNICYPCGYYCSSCTSSACTTCSVLNSSPSTGVDCACDSGYTDSGTSCDYCNGYVSSNICYPCGNLCNSCTSLTCTSCVAYSTASGIDCFCNSGYVDSGSSCDPCSGYVLLNTCYPCGNLCNSCTSSACTSCANHSTANGISCICDNGYIEAQNSCEICNGYVISNTCYNCQSLCTQCTETECLYCSGGSYINGTFCECQQGYFDNGNYCDLCLGYVENSICYLCNELCESCNSTNCLSCTGGSSPIGNICECPTGYTKNDTGCYECNGYIEDNICKPCGSLCDTCTNQACTQCAENSISHGTYCVCESGYTGTDKCTLIQLKLDAYFDNSNIIFLQFSEPLSRDLNKDYLIVTIDNGDMYYNLYKDTSAIYEISIEINFDKYIGKTVDIVFDKPIYSIYGAALNISSVSLVIENNDNTISISMSSIKTFSETLVQSCLYTLIALTAVNPSPASLWSFVSTIQMLVYIYLANIDIGIRLRSSLIGLKKYQAFPNLFPYFYVYPGKDHEFTKAANLGFPTNSILYNLGRWISCFMIFITLFFVLSSLKYLLGRTKFKDSGIYNKIKEKCQEYHYGFFLRFWIQGYIEFSVAVAISLYTSNLTTLDEAFNFYMTLIIAAIVLISPPVCYFVAWKKQNMKTTKSVQAELWVSFYYEFKNDEGAMRSNFYTFYFLRRFLFIFILFVLRDYPILQICLIEILMLTMFFYVTTMKPFDEMALNYSNSASEFGLSIIIPLVGVNLFNLTTTAKDQLDYCLIILVNYCVSVQMVASIFITFKVIMQKIKNRKSKKSNKVQPQYTSVPKKTPAIQIIPPEEEKLACGYDNVRFNSIISPVESFEASLRIPDDNESIVKSLGIKD